MHTNSSHRQRALEIPEIMLGIIHQLDMATLLTSQRVCHTWANMIRESKTLQKKLYFLPDNHEDNDEPPNHNPLLAEKFPFLKQFIRLKSDQMAGFSSYEPWFYDWEAIKLRKLDLLRSPAKQDQYMRPEASWRRMLTHQPPLYTVGRFSGHYGSRGSFWDLAKATEQSDGLRMEALFYWVVTLLFDQMSETEISIYIGKGLPADTIEQSIAGTGRLQCLLSSELDKMARQFDIVLARQFPYDSDEEDFTSSIPPPSENEIILEQLRHGVHRRMTEAVQGLDFETYNEDSFTIY